MIEINDEIIVCCIELVEVDLVLEGQQYFGVKYCWLVLGSEGRGEQLFWIDQDNVLVFEDVLEDVYECIKNYYLDFVGWVICLFNEVGFEYCLVDMMVSNFFWCLLLSEWKQQFFIWIYKLEFKVVMFCIIFFDFCFIYGDCFLFLVLIMYIFEVFDDQEIFFVYLGKNVL